MKTKNCNQLHTLVHVGARSSVSPEKIVLLESDSNYTKIILKDGSIIFSSTTMGVIEKRLSGYNFFRPNRSTIINLQYFDQVKNHSKDKASLSLRGGGLKKKFEIKISRRRQATFFENFNL
ncbi:LytTr DNA-binding domain-containing protein [Spirosomataceae bacterium TFI 002]|nr:LytTr DNA-binding domain-containing protein [Spirosomataceae bacterium TFI 002]